MIHISSNFHTYLQVDVIVNNVKNQVSAIFFFFLGIFFNFSIKVLCVLYSWPKELEIPFVHRNIVFHVIKVVSQILS